MASEPSSSSDAFDIRTLRQLVKLMNDNDLAEVDLRNAEQRIRLRKRGSEIVPIPTAFPAVMPAADRAAVAAPPPGPEKTATSEAAAQYVEIKSPMVGTFYRASSPDAQPFVQVGSHVDVDAVVCIIEAMKVFNEIAAETRGKIVAILAENGKPVEYGQRLFRMQKL